MTFFTERSFTGASCITKSTSCPRRDEQNAQSWSTRIEGLFDKELARVYRGKGVRHAGEDAEDDGKEEMRWVWLLMVAFAATLRALYSYYVVIFLSSRRISAF